ncbi:ABC transporter permease [Sediminibacterium roseum]|uniref:ABC transporter permease n=1 Tax=Sediminibacterium roseum TaxID=1978412 RepID=A0ABW9ZRP4_9BACT|nr:ABC transporter permease [Sediminibacterium roseum]NCI49185.1 ABC transporter permease [Sediminibacterium roseum]
MNKIALIIKREYVSRVRNKAFILSTLLTPLLFAGLFGINIWMSIRGNNTSKHNIAVIDKSGIFKNNLKGTEELEFSFPEGVDTSNFIAKGYTDILLISDLSNPQGKTNYIIRSEKSLGYGLKKSVERRINAAIEDQRLQDNGIRKSQLDSIHKESQFAELKTEQLTNDNKATESNEGMATMIGYACGILIYITMLVYGMMLMRGVMEEKTNRIAEVIVSSVKPFQLMMGKIIGVGAVGITQFLLWIILMFVLITAAQGFIPHDVLEQAKTLQQNGGIMPGGGMVQASEGAQKLYAVTHSMNTANWPVIIGCFIFYFLGGYLFYAALFAAVGSVMEDIQASQNLTLPIMMPIIFSFVIMTSVIQNPTSPLAFWASIIPFSSPIVMMARVSFGVPGTVPYWQLATSMLTLAAGFIFTTWLAGKIYRTGLLMYGKKVSWKEMFKWAFRSN